MRYGGLIIAIVVAAVAALAVLKMSINTQAPAPTTQAPVAEVKTVNVYIATKAIPIGTVITEDMIGPQPWPEHLTVDGFVTTGDSSFNPIGMVARGAYQQNEPLMKSKLANPSDPNFLAGELPAGMRVVTIPLNEVDGVAGFVFPGDHVDLIFTHDIQRWESAPSADGSGAGTAQQVKETVTETLLTNVKILAVDQHSSTSDVTDKNGKLIVPKSASVMVTQEDAQRVRLAQKTGTVGLILRSLADRGKYDAKLLTGSRDISLSEDGEDALSSPDFIKVIRGAPGSGTENADGSSVSRGVGGGSGDVPGNPIGKPITMSPKGNPGAVSLSVGFP